MNSFASQNRFNVLVRITAICWITSKFLSHNLWGIHREFPLLPFYEFNLIDSVHDGLFYATFTGLVFVFLFPANRFIVFLVLSLEIFCCLLDQMRWQPWQYQYMLTLFMIVIFNKDIKQFFLWFFWLLVFTYIYSGLHKINGGFLYEIWENLILRKAFNLPNNTIASKEIHYAGLIIPILEILLGISLLIVKKYRKWILLLLICMHLLIILLLSPVLLNKNSVVIPWNIAMIFYLLLYFKYYELNFVLTFKYRINYLLFIIIGVMPFTNFVGFWDDYTSFKLYSGNSKSLKICVSKNKIPKALNPYIYNKKNSYCSDSNFINVDNWAYKELNVPSYSEKRVFQLLKQKLIKKHPNTFEKFTIVSYPYKKENFEILP